MPRIGCNSHRLNVATKQLIDDQCGVSAVMKAISETMSQTLKLKTFERLRGLCHLKEVLPNDTQSTERFDMVQTIFHFENYLLNIPELDKHLLTPTIRCTLVNILDHLKVYERDQCYFRRTVPNSVGCGLQTTRSVRTTIDLSTASPKMWLSYTTSFLKQR